MFWGPQHDAESYVIENLRRTGDFNLIFNRLLRIVGGTVREADDGTRGTMAPLKRVAAETIKP